MTRGWWWSLCIGAVLLTTGCWARFDPFDQVLVPSGKRPLLYRPGVDRVINLEESTFDAVILQDKTRSAVVNFYVDWMGGSYAFSKYFVRFAERVASWHDLLVVAAVNCADKTNIQLCGNKDASEYPKVVYFGRDNTRSDGYTLPDIYPYSKLQDGVVYQMFEEHYNSGAVQSCNDYLYDSRDLIIVINNDHERFASKYFLLDWFQYSKTIPIGYCKRSTDIERRFNINCKDCLVVIARSEQHVHRKFQIQGPSNLQRYLNVFETMDRHYPEEGADQSWKPIDCNLYEHAEVCKSYFHVSEHILIDAFYITLNEELHYPQDVVGDTDFQVFRSFVFLMIDYFPVATTFKHGINEVASFTQLDRCSEVVAKHRKGMHMKLNKTDIKQTEWKDFIGKERVKLPPAKPSWSYCTGTSSKFRGYPCGLWTLLHSVIANVYMNAGHVDDFNPVEPLRAIREYIKKFMKCVHCRILFEEITTYVYPLNSFTVKNKDDMLLYLWHVHNIFNQRLQGLEDSEDPQFPKQQFPPRFLCQVCHSGGKFSREKVRDFLLAYYTNIVPLE